MIRRSLEQKRFYYAQKGFYKKNPNELETIEERVCWLLQRHNHSRNCHKCLLFLYWQGFDGDALRAVQDLASSETVHKLTTAELVTRACRMVQNTIGYWIPTEKEVIKTRRITEEVIREWANGGLGI